MPYSPFQRPFRNAIRHGWKTWVFQAVTFVALVSITRDITHWLAAVVWAAYILLVLIPVAFGFGPLGRRLNSELNDDAIAYARQQREALGPRGET